MTALVLLGWASEHTVLIQKLSTLILGREGPQLLNFCCSFLFKSPIVLYKDLPIYRSPENHTLYPPDATWNVTPRLHFIARLPLCLSMSALGWHCSCSFASVKSHQLQGDTMRNTVQMAAKALLSSQGVYLLRTKEGCFFLFLGAIKVNLQLCRSFLCPGCIFSPIEVLAKPLPARFSVGAIKDIDKIILSGNNSFHEEIISSTLIILKDKADAQTTEQFQLWIHIPKPKIRAMLTELVTL